MQIIRRLRSVVEGAGDRGAKGRRIAELIRQAGAYRWVGLYDVAGKEALIICWSGPGPPAHPRFPANQGLTGSAIQTRTPVIVSDVTRDPRYLTAFESTRSEMIVPIFDPATGVPVGTLDVESDRIDAFGESDQALLEQCAVILAPLFGG
jgi:putative methionine-R-sulfoxide reductase with GAF domain